MPKTDPAAGDLCIINRTRAPVEEKTLKSVLVRALGEEKVSARGRTLNLMLVGSRRIRALKRRYFGLDRTTDVIAFPGGGGPHIGDLCVCPQTALKSHRRFGTTPDEELALYCIHGLLHLLGYEDKDMPGFERMKRRQEFILGKIIRRGTLKIFGNQQAAPRRGRERKKKT